MKRTAMAVLALVAALCIGFMSPANAQILWYNGDFDGRNGLSNERATAVTDGAVFDDFIVPVGETWNITSVFSNNLMNITAVSADWEIRSGVSSGNAGSLVAGGNGAASVVATGRSGFGFNEYTVSTAVGVVLGPGTYWLMVRPVDSGSGRSFVSMTSGANSVGSPAGNNDNSFFSSAFFGSNYAPASGFVSTSPADFSMGVMGNNTAAVPEGSTLGLIAVGLVPIALGLRKRVRR